MGRKSGKRSSLPDKGEAERSGEALKILDIALGMLCERCEEQIQEERDKTGKRLCKKCEQVVSSK